MRIERLSKVAANATKSELAQEPAETGGERDREHAPPIESFELDPVLLNQPAALESERAGVSDRAAEVSEGRPASSLPAEPMKHDVIEIEGLEPLPIIELSASPDPVLDVQKNSDPEEVRLEVTDLGIALDEYPEIEAAPQAQVAETPKQTSAAAPPGAMISAKVPRQAPDEYVEDIALDDLVEAVPKSETIRSEQSALIARADATTSAVNEAAGDESESQDSAAMTTAAQSAAPVLMLDVDEEPSASSEEVPEQRVAACSGVPSVPCASGEPASIDIAELAESQAAPIEAPVHHVSIAAEPFSQSVVQETSTSEEDAATSIECISEVEPEAELPLETESLAQAESALDADDNVIRAETLQVSDGDAEAEQAGIEAAAPELIQAVPESAPVSIEPDLLALANLPRLIDSETDSAINMPSAPKTDFNGSRQANASTADQPRSTQSHSLLETETEFSIDLDSELERLLPESALPPLPPPSAVPPRKRSMTALELLLNQSNMASMASMAAMLPPSAGDQSEAQPAAAPEVEFATTAITPALSLRPKVFIPPAPRIFRPKLQSNGGKPKGEGSSSDLTVPSPRYSGPRPPIPPPAKSPLRLSGR